MLLVSTRRVWWRLHIRHLLREGFGPTNRRSVGCVGRCSKPRGLGQGLWLHCCSVLCTGLLCHGCRDARFLYQRERVVILPRISERLQPFIGKLCGESLCSAVVSGEEGHINFVSVGYRGC
jgi:hypothetical protein